jgi:2-polyprenyl-3-methyl-5-hydroxy-6-metoxy-1,4-benzoquinol methylase
MTHDTASRTPAERPSVETVRASVNAKTAKSHWDAVWTTEPRLRLPRPYSIAELNLHRLLRRYVRAGSSFLEIGCAPGKTLAWVGARLGARVSGLDYSEIGIAFARRLFGSLELAGDLRCEDVFATTFERASFDVVYSAGVIEHFDDPRPLVTQHFDLVRPGGLALITVPNYGGWYGRLQGRLDPANLGIHNLGIMNPAALRALAPAGARASAFYAGRFSPWLLSLDRTLPRALALLASHLGNALGQLQPWEVAALAPLVVLALEKA